MRKPGSHNERKTGSENKTVYDPDRICGGHDECNHAASVGGQDRYDYDTADPSGGGETVCKCTSFYGIVCDRACAYISLFIRGIYGYPAVAADRLLWDRCAVSAGVDHSVVCGTNDQD